MKTRRQEIGDGDPAIDRTIAEMTRLAKRDAKDSRVSTLAERLRSGQPAMDAARSAFMHVVRSISYVNDPPRIEKVVAPIYTLSLARPFHPYGDCDDMATALVALLLAMEIDARFCVIAHDYDDDGAPRDQFSHVYVVMVIDGRQVPMDPVMGVAGWSTEKRHEVWRRKVYGRCSMQLVTLEDGPARLSGCKCGGRCGCGGSRRQGCCPQAAQKTQTPVNVNVITNTGSMDQRQYTDESRYAPTDQRFDQSRIAYTQVPIVGARAGTSNPRTPEMMPTRQQPAVREMKVSLPGPAPMSAAQPVPAAVTQAFGQTPKRRRRPAFREFY